MKSVLLVFCFLCGVCHGQTRKFVLQAEDLILERDSTTSISYTPPSSEEFNFVAQGPEELEELFRGVLGKVARSRPDDLMESHTLQLMADVAIECWKGSQYSNTKKWKKLEKYFKRVSNLGSKRFHILRSSAFRVKLADNNGKRFHHSKDQGDNGLNLFYGRPLTKEQKEQGKSLVALPFQTEEDLVQFFIRQIRRRGLLSDLKKGNFAYVGISVEVDEKSLGKNKIPTARVVVILGARRMKNVKIKNT